MVLFFKDKVTTEIDTYCHTLSHLDDLPICRAVGRGSVAGVRGGARALGRDALPPRAEPPDTVAGRRARRPGDRHAVGPAVARLPGLPRAGPRREPGVRVARRGADRAAVDLPARTRPDRKSTRLNSSH